MSPQVKHTRDSLIFDLRAMATECEEWADNLRENMRVTLGQIGQAWAAGAKKRAPVDEGTLRNAISYSVKDTATSVVLYVGVPAELDYAAHVEFGTKYIAGGRVKALGLSDEITDADAIKLWPAKNEGERKRKGGVGIDTGFLSSKTGQFQNAKAKAAHDAAVAQVLAGGVAEQMPWLRPAFSAIVDQAVELIWYAAGVEANG